MIWPEAGFLVRTTVGEETYPSINEAVNGMHNCPHYPVHVQYVVKGTVGVVQSVHLGTILDPVMLRCKVFLMSWFVDCLEGLHAKEQADEQS